MREANYVVRWSHTESMVTRQHNEATKQCAEITRFFISLLPCGKYARDIPHPRKPTVFRRASPCLPPRENMCFPDPFPQFVLQKKYPCEGYFIKLFFSLFMGRVGTARIAVFI